MDCRYLPLTVIMSPPSEVQRWSDSPRVTRSSSEPRLGTRIPSAVALSMPELTESPAPGLQKRDFSNKDLGDGCKSSPSSGIQSHPPKRDNLIHSRETTSSAQERRLHPPKRDDFIHPRETTSSTQERQSHPPKRDNLIHPRETTSSTQERQSHRPKRDNLIHTRESTSSTQERQSHPPKRDNLIHTRETIP